jgi:hypothetical protein
MTDLLCLAYSRKYSARCLAGLHLDTFEWVRPVSASEHGELSAAVCRLDIGRAPRPLDVIRIQLKNPRPESHQPENWLVGDREWKLVDQWSLSDAKAHLDAKVLSGPRLLGDTSDSIDWDWIQENGVEASLGLVKVRPSFRVNPWGSLRAGFELRSTCYDLAVTDVAAWTNEVSQPDYRVQSDWYFTISLGERYVKKNRAYKPVAAGIEVRR